MSKHIKNGNNLGAAKDKTIKKKQKSSPPLVTVMKEWSGPQPKPEVQNIVEYSGGIHEGI